MKSSGSVVSRSNRSAGIALLLPVLCVIAMLGPSPAFAAIDSSAPLWETGETGSGAGQTIFPRGLAGDPSNGHIFVADQNNVRIDEFTAWGNFVKAWGWDVVASGPGNDSTVPEDQFEICTPGNKDSCKSGESGSGAGQFSLLEGVAVDSEGNVFVVDFANHRVQKFDSAGHFLKMFGGEVNKTKVDEAAPEAQRNLCPVDPSDVCGGGTVGSGNGQFGSWALGGTITIDPNDRVLVGDQERIQVFNNDGVYQSQISLPGETVQSLAVDAESNLYVSYALCVGCASKANVHKLSPAGIPVAPETFLVQDPRAIAVDSGGDVFVFDQSAVQPSNPLLDRPPILEFNSAAEQTGSFGKGDFFQSTGMAANICAGSDPPGSLYITNIEPTSFIRAYGTIPLGCEEPPKVPPDIKAQYGVTVDSHNATLRATVNPHFIADTTYFVEYGTGACAAGGCDRRMPLGAEAQLGGEITNADLTTSGVFLNGLQPDTTYHFRFVAKSSGGGPVYGIDPDGEGNEKPTFDAGLEATVTTPPLPSPAKSDCLKQELRSGPSSFLPDCRAFEMVSPVDKNGAGIETSWAGANSLAHQSLDESDGAGEQLAYSSKQAFGDQVSSPKSSQYLAKRNPVSGWSSHGINAPREGFPGLDRQALDTEYKAFLEDLSSGWFIHEGEPPLDLPCSPANSPVLYRRDNADDSYEALHCEANKKANGPNTIELLGISGDGCRAIFRSNSKLTPNALASSVYQLYESSCEGPLRLVGVLPSGLPCKSDSSAGSSLSGVEGSSSNGRTRSVYSAFSPDAKRLYWECGTSLYLRTDPDPTTEGETGEEVVKIADPVAGEPPRFQSASPDGSRALITVFDLGSLKFVLRSYDVVSKTSTLIAPLFKSATGVRSDLLGASADARTAYFVSGDILTEAENDEGGKAVAGLPNLYVYEEGSGISFIATLGAQDVNSGLRVLSPVHSLRFRRASRVTPDGLHAAFISSAPLTGYDNTDAVSGEADAEVFVYDAEPGGVGELRCVSCNPTGARPHGRNISEEVLLQKAIRWAAAWIPGWQTQLYPSRPFSEDGNRLFFNSVDALVGRDNNNRVDVYEWERADSKEECVKELGAELYVASAGGCLSLISTGQDSEDSEFVDADKDGSDVFIRTNESLLPQDPGLVDIYDARIDGGFPPPPPPKPECEGEACQSPPAPPAFETPSSSAFNGPGDPTTTKRPGKCPKGRHRITRRGKSRCVPNKNRKSKRANSKSGRAGR